MLPTDSPPPAADGSPPEPDPPEVGPPSSASADAHGPADVAQVAYAQPARWPHPSLLQAIFWTLLLLGAQIVVGVWISLAAIVVSALSDQPDETQAFLTGLLNVLMLPLGTATTLLVAVAVVALMYRSQTSRLLGWRRLALQQWVWILMIVVPLAVLASEVTNCMSDLLALFEPEWLSDFRQLGGQAFEQFGRQPFWLVFAAACLLPGLGEEIYCRGFLSRGLIARHGVIAGTLITSFLFGALHIEPVQATGAFFLAIGLQFVFLVTRSLLAPIVVHTLNNSLAFAAMRYSDRFPIPGLTQMPDGSVVHTPLLLMLTATLALVSLAALLLKTRTRWVLPDGSTWSPGYVSAESPPRQLSARAVSAAPNWWLVGICLVAYAAMVAAAVIANRAAAA